MTYTVYDVIIVGAGPAGLRCAEILGKSELSVLLLEKNAKMGQKVCAGGITRKDLAILDLPDNVIEHKVTKTAVYSRNKSSTAIAQEPFVLKEIFPLSRSMGNHQLPSSFARLTPSSFKSSLLLVRIAKEPALLARSWVKLA